jgi:hypothetical protein
MKKPVVRFKKEDFIAEVRSYKKLAYSLGEIEYFFLGLISLCATLTGKPPILNSMSAYDIYLHLQKIGKPMGYPNVLKRVRRLEELGLIKFKCYHKRKAIHYELTPRGLFERLLMPRSIYYAVHPIIWHYWRENTILQMILYQYFDLFAVWKFREFSILAELVDNYLRNCCEAILVKLEQSRNSDSLQFEIEQIIENEFKDLILRIISISNMENQRRNKAPSSKFVPYLPYAVLKNDSKFMTLLKKMKLDFDNGIKNFI